MPTQFLVFNGDGTQEVIEKYPDVSVIDYVPPVISKGVTLKNITLHTDVAAFCEKFGCRALISDGTVQRYLIGPSDDVFDLFWRNHKFLIEAKVAAAAAKRGEE